LEGEGRVKIGSLFSGYGGLDMGVQSALGGEVAWFVEFDEAPSKILEYHWPDVPNYGDITQLDFSKVEPVDVITGGFPCQDLSLAGRRAGMRPGTRSGLWADYLRAIATLRPRLAVIENVRGLLSGCAESDSDLEPCPGCLGESDVHRPVLRALGRVLGDLADIGYDAEWIGVSASDAGATHGRFRVFVLAHPAGQPWSVADRDDVRPWGLANRRGSNAGRGAVEDAHGSTGGERGVAAPGQTQGGRSRSDAGRRGGASATDPERSEGWLGHEPDEIWGRSDETEQAGLGDLRTRFGDYAPAVARWEALTRPAPSPVNPRGKLSTEFVEWMMGLDEGHVTSVPGLSDDDRFKALGNGVVPQQAALAVAVLTSPSWEKP
jgi:DNA (cytosine-5)-methyltransferase 1